MIQRWLTAAILITSSCALEEYNPAVTVRRDPGDWTSTTGDGAPGDSSPGDAQGDPRTGDAAGDPRTGDAEPGDPRTGDAEPGDPFVPPQSTRLNVDSVATGDVTSFQVTPDGTKVVYLSDVLVDDRWQLHAVDLDGGNHVLVSTNITGGGQDVVEFAISADSLKVVYLADVDIDNHFELFAANIDGSDTPVKLHPDLATNEVIYKWRVSSDNRVVIRGDLTVNGNFELYSNNLLGTDFLTISGDIIAGEDVHKFMMSPDNSLVGYWSDETNDGRYELRVVNPDGSGNVRVHAALDGTIPTNRDVLETFFISPDNTKVVFVADFATEHVFEVYVGTVATSTAVRVSGDLFDPVDGEIARELWWLPDSSRVIYRADQDTDEHWELYSALADGSGTAAKLHPALAAGRATGSVGFVPGSSKILLTGDFDQLSVFELYSVNPDGTSFTKLNSAYTFGQNIVRFAVAPDSSRVVYLANEGDVGQLDLFSVTPTGASRTRMTNFGAGGNVYNFSISPDSSRVVFTADGDFDGVIELYAVGLDGSGLVRLNDAVGSGSDVANFLVAGTHAIYTADLDTPGIRELYAKDGLATPGGGFSVASNTPVLVDGALARYYLDEASAGRSPTEAIDSAASPLNLPILWDPNMAYIAGPGGNGLQWQRVDAPGTPTVYPSTIDGTKLDTLDGSTTGTLEVLVDVDADTESEPRFIYFGQDGGARGFCLLYDGPRKRVKFWHDYPDTSAALWWGVDLLGTGRHLLTAVLDSNQGAEMVRVVLYVDGVVLPGFREAPGATPSSGEGLDLVNVDHDKDGGTTTPAIDYDFYIGNRESGERSNDGRIYYAAVYDVALTDAEVYQNATVLLHDDDTP